MGWRTMTLSAIAERFGIEEPVDEHRFDSKRQWRFDYAWPKLMVALEIEGGVWTKGRHIRPIGYIGDIEKYNAATLAGWRVFRATPAMLHSNSFWEMLRSALLLNKNVDELE